MEQKKKKKPRQCGSEYPVVIACSVFWVSYTLGGGGGNVLSFNCNCDTERYHLL